ncbi:MAG: hypothetical protein IPN81_10745 [Nitrosomonadales bacterium]|nr:hypothetical protein [Nitrosomonadales bacterium]
MKQEQVIDKDPAAWCAIELALLDLLGKSEGLSLESLLALPPMPPILQYSAVLGNNDLAIFSKQVLKYVSVGFRDFKIKLSGDLEIDLRKIACLLDTVKPCEKLWSCEQPLAQTFGCNRLYRPVRPALLGNRRAACFARFGGIISQKLLLAQG